MRRKSGLIIWPVYCDRQARYLEGVLPEFCEYTMTVSDWKNYLEGSSMSSNDFDLQSALPPMAPNDAHMACCLLVDVSSSMGVGNSKTGKTPIDQLNEGLMRFCEQVQQDEQSKKVVDVAIITFNEAPHLVQGWRPVASMEVSTLTASGGTAFVPALQEAITQVQDRMHLYRRTIGEIQYKPWIVMITDGMNEHGPSVDTIAPTIHELDEQGKLRLWVLGVDDYDARDVAKLTHRHLALRDQDFTSFFDWLGKSMRVISKSKPDANLELPPLPQTVYIPDTWI